jgi:hypothetical protein
MSTPVQFYSIFSSSYPLFGNTHPQHSFHSCSSDPGRQCPSNGYQKSTAPFGYREYPAVKKPGHMLLPRLVRQRDAPFYLGMDRNRFKAEIRPYLIQVSIGVQGIAFDRLELDAFAEQYISRNGCPGKPLGELSWQTKRHPASSKGPNLAHRQKDRRKARSKQH